MGRSDGAEGVPPPPDVEEKTIQNGEESLTEGLEEKTMGGEEPQAAPAAPANLQRSTFQEQQQRREDCVSEMTMFRVWGVPVKLHFTFPLYLLFVMIGEYSAAQWQFELGLRASGFVVLFFSVLVHELAHASYALNIGGTVRQIVMWPLGGICYCGAARNRCGQIGISLAGPLVHIPIGVALYFLARKLGVESPVSFLMDPVGIGMQTTPLSPVRHSSPVQLFFALLAAQGFAAQVWLFIFNLLIPCYPLDGGIILATLLQYLFDQSMSAAFTISLSFVLAIAMFSVGLAREMFSLVMIGLWCGFSGLNLFQYWSTDFLYMHPLFAHRH